MTHLAPRDGAHLSFIIFIFANRSDSYYRDEGISRTSRDQTLEHSIFLKPLIDSQSCEYSTAFTQFLHTFLNRSFSNLRGSVAHPRKHKTTRWRKGYSIIVLLLQQQNRASHFHPKTYCNSLCESIVAIEREFEV
jgi:hypothetical protein